MASKYLASVTVVTGINDGVRATDSGGAFTATITAGTYYVLGDGTADDLLQAIEDALDTDGTDDWTLALDASKHVTITCAVGSGSQWSVDWDNAATTFDGELLGIDDTSADFGDGSGESGTTETTDYQHQGGWYGTYPAAADTGGNLAGTPTAEVQWQHPPAGAPSVALVGSRSTLRTITHVDEPTHKAIPHDDYTNHSWVEFWLLARDGRPLRYYYDASDHNTYYECTLTGDALERPRPARTLPQIPTYSWAVQLASY